MRMNNRVWVAADFSNPIKALALVRRLHGLVGGFKVGLEVITSIAVSLLSAMTTDEAMIKLREWKELFNAIGPNLIWDGKFDDIPNTVKAAVAALGPLSPAYCTVHASAGIEALKVAVANRGDTGVIGVTVLTSINEQECVSIFGGQPGEKVRQFARILLAVGAQAIVCSPQELRILKDEGFVQLRKFTPGIRPAFMSPGGDDQSRTMTPAEAIREGAYGLIVGRPITQPPDSVGTPERAVELIVEEIESV